MFTLKWHLACQETLWFFFFSYVQVICWLYAQRAFLVIQRFKLRVSCIQGTHSEIAPDRLGKQYEMLGIEAWSVPGWPHARQMTYCCASSLATKTVLLNKQTKKMNGIILLWSRLVGVSNFPRRLCARQKTDVLVPFAPGLVAASLPRTWSSCPAFPFWGLKEWPKF